MVQTILFRGGGGVALDIEIATEDGVFTIVTRHHPSGEDTGVNAFTNAVELPDAIEDRVTAHFEAHHSRLRTIRWTEGRGPVGFRDLGRYGVPLMSIDTGAQPK